MIGWLEFNILIVTLLAAMGRGGFVLEILHIPNFV